MNKKKLIKYIFWIIFCLLFTLIFGTMLHEFVGHGLTGIYYGGEIDRVCVLFINYNLSTEKIFIEPCIFGKTWTLIPEENINNDTLSIFTVMGSIPPLIISIIFTLVILFGKFNNFYTRTFIYSLAIQFIDPVYNYVKPYLFGGGSDFQNLLQYNSISPLPLAIFSLILGMLTISAIIYKEYNISKNSKQTKKK